MYLLLGNPQDPCCAQVDTVLRSRGGRTLWAADLFLSATVRWRFGGRRDGGAGSSRLQFSSGVSLSADEISGVLVREPLWDGSEGWSAGDAMYMSSEVQAALLGWLWSLPSRVVNRLPPWLWYRPQPPFVSWLPMLRRAGLRTLDMAISNDAEGLRRWQRRHNGGAVYAPLTSPEHFLLGSEAEWSVIAALAQRCPVALREPHGEAFLACLVNDLVFWNTEPAEMPAQMHSGMQSFARTAGLDVVQFTVAECVDDGRPGHRCYAVTAVDPMVCLPLFHAKVQQAISGAIADLLMAPKPDVAMPLREFGFSEQEVLRRPVS